MPGTETGGVGFTPPLLAVVGDTDDIGTDWEVMNEDSDTGASISTLLWKIPGKMKEDM